MKKRIVVLDRGASKQEIASAACCAHGSTAK